MMAARLARAEISSKSELSGRLYSYDVTDVTHLSLSL